MARHTYPNILLLAEGSEEGMKAAREAISLAADEDAFLTILTVVDTNTLRQLLASRIFVQDEMEEYERELEESCRRQLAYVAQLAERAHVKCRTSLVRGACHSAVLREQKACSADLLVMGAYRARMGRRDLIAQEKQLIVDEITCPILLVR